MKPMFTMHIHLAPMMLTGSSGFRAPPRTHETAEIIDHAFQHIQPGIAPALLGQIPHKARLGALLAHRATGVR